MYYHENQHYQQQRAMPMNPQFHPGNFQQDRSAEPVYAYPNQGGYPIHQQAGAPYGMNQRQILIEDAIQIARAQVPGEVVSAELERKQGRLIYEVDIISTEGPVYEVKVDQITGEILEIELD